MEEWGCDSIIYRRLEMFVKQILTLILLVMLSGVVKDTMAQGFYSDSFEEKVEFATNNGPSDVATGDLDGDGKLDMVVANMSNIISIYRNVSTPGSLDESSFEEKIDISVPSPRGIAIGDLTGDGKPEIIVASYNYNRVYVFKNSSSDGTLSFDNPSFYTTGIRPIDVAVNDINDDGNLDIITANNYGSSISIFLNRVTGDIDFTPKIDVSMASGSRPSDLIVEDINRDNKPDIIVSDDYYNVIHIFPNTSNSGSLSLANELYETIPSKSQSITVSDLSGDLFPEIITANLTAGSFTVLYNTRSYGFINRGNFSTGGTPISIASGNLDTDEKSDLVIVNSGANVVSVSGNKTQGSQVLFSESTQIATSSAISKVTMADIDGDGRNDIITLNPQVRAVSVLRNVSEEPVFNSEAFTTGTSFATGSSVNDAATGDLDRDGKPDLVSLNSGDNSISVLLNTSASGSIDESSYAAGINLATGNGPRKVIIGRVNYDTKPDIIVANSNEETISVYINTSSVGALSFNDRVDFSLGFSPLDMALGDLDGDGKNDLAVINSVLNAVLIMQNESLFSASFSSVQYLPGVYSASDIIIEDVDLNNKPDIIVASVSSAFFVFQNVSTPGTFSFSGRNNIFNAGASYAITTGDINGDGAPDLITTSDNGSVNVLQNNSSGGSLSIANPVTFQIQSYLGDIAVADFDGDERPDLAVMRSGYIYLLRNRTSAGGIISSDSFENPTEIRSNANSYAIIAEDFDGDGGTDLAFPNYYGVEVWHKTYSPPEIIVTGNATEIINGDNTPSPDDYTDFGNVSAASGMMDRQFTIQNNGLSALVIRDDFPMISGAGALNFEFVRRPDQIISGGRSSTFSIRFSPNSISTQIPIVHVLSNDPTNANFTFSIKGTGINIAPSASDVAIAGMLNIGKTLTASYTFTDDGTESGTIFKWFRSEDISGIGKTAIAGATDVTYVPIEADYGKYLSVEVTPGDGLATGTPVESALQGPVGMRGSGTEADPYQVFTLPQLQEVKDYLTSHFILMNNIDASATSGWNKRRGFDPVGTYSANPFSGNFNGQGYSITNLYINRPTSNIGLFGFIGSGGVVQNISLEDVDITGDLSTGGLAGRNEGSISGISVSGQVTSSDRIVGGLVGFILNGTISECSADIAITASSYTAGGLVGSSNNATITNTYAIGQVSGNLYLGGLVGVVSNGTIISRSYASVQINGASDMGGLFGYYDTGNTTASFWDMEISELTTSPAGTGKTTLDMQTLSTFTEAGWDFDTIWSIDEGGYPFLQEKKHRELVITGDEGWRILSSPSAGVSFGTLLDTLWTQGFPGSDNPAGDPNVMLWDETTRSWALPGSADDVPAQGIGFLVYVFSDQNHDGTDENFPKIITNTSGQYATDLPLSLSFTNSGILANDGWNLLGNPYGSTLNWDMLEVSDKTNIDNSIYIWSENANGGAGTYLSWNGVTGTIENGKIAPWQGFWAKAITTSPSFTFRNSARSRGGIFRKQAPISQLRFSLEGNGLSSDAIVLFHEEAIKGHDRYDAYKLASYNARYLSLATSLENQELLEIQSLPLELKESTELALAIDGSDLNGNFELNWEFLAISEGWEVYLKDLQTGNTIDLNKEENYRFSLNGPVRKQSTPVSGLNSLPALKPNVQKAATESRFRLVISAGPVVGNEENEELPRTLGLSQNYPNPFNPSTVINYQLPVSSKVELHVFDMIGREVAILVNEQKQAGYHQVTFDAGNIASGVYIYLLKAGNTVLTKKLTLIK